MAAGWESVTPKAQSAFSTLQKGKWCESSKGTVLESGVWPGMEICLPVDPEINRSF